MAMQSSSYQPEVLVEQAVLAESVGFDVVLASDHFHPWVDDTSAAGFAWTWLGAVAARTSRVELGAPVPVRSSTIVRVSWRRRRRPSTGYHPAGSRSVSALARRSMKVPGWHFLCKSERIDPDARGGRRHRQVLDGGAGLRGQVLSNACCPALQSASTSRAVAARGGWSEVCTIRRPIRRQPHHGVKDPAGTRQSFTSTVPRRQNGRTVPRRVARSLRRGGLCSLRTRRRHGRPFPPCTDCGHPAAGDARPSGTAERAACHGRAGNPRQICRGPRR